MTTITRNPRLTSRSPKAEFTLAYAVNARDADNMEKRTLIPSGTDIIIMRRFGRLPSSGKSMVEFALAEPSGDEVGKFYRAWSDELVPVGSKRAKEMTQAKAKGGFMPNPSTRNPAKLKFLWDHNRTGHWQAIYGGLTKAYVIKSRRSGKYYVEMPGPQGGMTYPQVEFDSLRKAKEWVEEHAKGGVALNPATTAPGKIKNIDGAVVLRNPSLGTQSRTKGGWFQLMGAPNRRLVIQTARELPDMKNWTGVWHTMKTFPFTSRGARDAAGYWHDLVTKWKQEEVHPIDADELVQWVEGIRSLHKNPGSEAKNPLPSNFADVPVRVEYTTSNNMPKLRAWARKNKATVLLEQYTRGAYSGRIIIHAPWNEGKSETDRKVAELKKLLSDMHPGLNKNPSSGVRIVHNRLLGGWFIVRGPHQTPLSGRFDSKVEAEAWLKKPRGSKQNPMSKLSSSERRKLSVPQQHQLRIARDTLKMPDAMVGVMGGPNKAEAREIIKRLTGRVAKENPESSWPATFQGLHLKKSEEGGALYSEEKAGDLRSFYQEIWISKVKLVANNREFWKALYVSGNRMGPRPEQESRTAIREEYYHSKEDLLANKRSIKESTLRRLAGAPAKNPLSTCPGCGKPISNQDAEPGVYTCDGCKAAVRVA